MIKNIIVTISIFISLVLALVGLQSAKTPKETDLPADTIAWKGNHRVYNPPMPIKADFCGEKVPLELFYVKEGIEREMVVNTYWHSNTILLMKRASRWLPEVETTLKINGVPDDIKYMLFIESGFDHVVSPSGAAGYWQLLEKTAREYGLEVNADVDERYHLVKSTEAACKYLKTAHKKFGNWTLAAASYNTGMKRVEEEIAQQGTANFYELLFSNETTRYINRIVAFKELYQNPMKYGFMLTKDDMYQPIATKGIKIDQTIPRLEEFAQNHKTNLRMVKYFNPWLRSRTLPVKPGKSYTISLP